jgi:hypothetical protein
VPYKHYLPGVNFRIIKKYLSFREVLIHEGDKKRFNPFKLLGVEQIINMNQRLYERFFAWILPCAEIYFELKAIK